MGQKKGKGGDARKECRDRARSRTSCPPTVRAPCISLCRVSQLRKCSAPVCQCSACVMRLVSSALPRG
jgi:hypothetical protein